jgi:hypothetical protein
VSPALDRALSGLAVGRIVLGTLARVAPRATTHMFGAGPAASPELDYMNRVFGARAFALGSGYLLSEGEPRRHWQRLALVCDVSDTLAGAGHLRRGDIPRSSAIAATLLTGGYMLVGLLKLARDLAPEPGEAAPRQPAPAAPAARSPAPTTYPTPASRT